MIVRRVQGLVNVSDEMEQEQQGELPLFGRQGFVEELPPELVDLVDDAFVFKARSVT